MILASRFDVVRSFAWSFFAGPPSDPAGSAASTPATPATRATLIRRPIVGSWLLVLGFAVFLGCGAQHDGYPTYMPSESMDDASSGDPSGLARSAARPWADEFESVPGDDVTAPGTGAEFERKLIQSAEASLIVEDFDAVPERIESLVRQHQGFIANSRIGGRRGARRTGYWQVRVPAERFEPFLAATSGIGEVVSIHRKSQDVTEEYFDVEARIRNKRVQEEGLLKILEERPGKLEDVLAVERELSRVREEMERMQGRLRLLANLTSLATVNIEVEEVKGFVPAESPTFARRISRNFEMSLDSLRQTGEYLVIALVVFLPWLLIVAILYFPVFLIIRQMIRRLTRRG